MLFNLLREEIKDLKPYHANQIACKYKLDANESPFDIPKNVRTYLASMLINSADMNLYPDTDCVELRKALAAKWAVEEDMIMVGNGSDQIIQVLVNTFAGKGDKVLYPNPSFSMYALTSKIAGAMPVSFALEEKKEFKYDVGKIIDLALKENPKIIFLCTPNNPTGNTLEIGEIEEIAKRCANSIIAVDEAYAEFGGESAISLIEKHENIIILRTFSKALGLAGTRCGYSIANREMTAYLNKVRPPYNLNTFTQKVAVACLLNSGEIDDNIEYIKKERSWLLERIKDIEKIKVYPSYANFLLIKVQNLDIAVTGLMQDGILVRGFKGTDQISDCIRVTIGNREQNEAFLDSLLKVI